MAPLYFAAQSAVRLLQLMAGAGAVALVMTSRFSSRFLSITGDLHQALSGAVLDPLLVRQYVLKSKSNNSKHKIASGATQRLLVAIGAAAESPCLCPGLIGEGCALRGDTVENVKHLQRKLAQAKFGGDPNEDRYCLQLSQSQLAANAVLFPHLDNLVVTRLSDCTCIVLREALAC